jgi:hypothetical protein
MTDGDDSDFSPASRFSFRTREEIGVHVLSEHVFCPRAALIADESGNDAGDEEPHLGPRLDMFIDYSEHEFTEALHKTWGEMWWFMTLLPAAILVVLLATYLHSPFAGLVLSLPVFLLVAKCWDALNNIIALVREQARYRAAPEFVIDSELTEITRLSWWSLRKAGFDCNKPPDTLQDPAGKLVGRPWRQLKKGGSIIPVVRRSRGNSEWGRQHEVRIAAYCDLIEKSEGAESPFGVILFSGTSDCVIIPNTNARHQLFDRAFKSVANFLERQAAPGAEPPNPPRDSLCSGCPHGKPRQFQRGKSETISNGKPLPARATLSYRSDGQVRGTFHSDCGDRFKWDPPHKDAIALGIAQER